METITQFKIDSTLWEIKKSVYENEKKNRTETTFHIFKNGESFTIPPYTHCVDVYAAYETILCNYYVKRKVAK